MRLEACTWAASLIQGVWHCEEARKLMCKWVDDDTMQYAEYVRDELMVKQAKKIVITRIMVYVNPVEGPEVEINEEQLEIA